MDPPGFPETDFGWLCGDVFSLQSGVEVCRRFCRRDVPDRLEQATVVKTLHPFDGFGVAPRPAPMHDPGFEETVIVSANALS